MARARLNSKEFSASDYILRDLLWDENEHSSPDAISYPRPRQGAWTGEEVLLATLSQASTGDVSARRVLRVLLEAASGQRPLKGMVRSRIPSGTHVVGPHGYILSGTTRIGVHRALLMVTEDMNGWLESLIRAVLAEPESVALAEAVTAILAEPRVAARVTRERTLLRDFFLLMSAHPDPRVRVSGLFGLSAFTPSDPDVHALLLQEANIRPEVRFTEANMARIRATLDMLGARHETWRDIYLAIYQRWLTQPFENRVQDMGDYDWERMANAAAAQALLMGVHPPRRKMDDGTVESIEYVNTLPRLDGLISGNGTGFRVYKVTRDAAGRVIHSNRISPPGIVVAANPINAWVLMGKSSGDAHTVFEAMLDQSIEFHYGHADSVLSWLRFKLLGEEPPAHFVSALGVFRTRLRAKWSTYVRELTGGRENVSLVGVSEISARLAEDSRRGADGAQVIPLPVRASAPPPSPEPTRSLEEIFAAKALEAFAPADSCAGQLR
ncbi:MAG: hypothetical protein HC902_05670 [Calothrix sp. SM1_5_4]|nr:hypothetical protein [Calothrix sp. SM1_5_4]